MSSLAAAVRLVLGRMRHDRLVLAGAAVIVLLATSLIAAGLIYADAVAAAGLERRLSVAPPSSSGIEIGAPLRADRLDALDATIRDGAGDLFGTDGALVARRISSASFALPSQPDDEVSELTVLRCFEGLESHASLVSGTWPAAAGEPVEAAVSTVAAAEMGLSLGDELNLTSRLDPDARLTVRIVGTWQPVDATDRYWWADELDLTGVAPGSTFTTHGPLVVAPGTFTSNTVAADGAAVDWRIIPEIGEISVSELPDLAARIDAFEALLPPTDQVTARGDLAEVLRSADRALTVTRASVTVIGLQLAILAGYVLVLTGGLIVERRRAETALASARGATSRQLLGAAALEAAVIAVPCGLLAPWIAGLTLGAFNVAGPLADTGLAIAPQVGTLAIVAALVAALACVVGLALPALSRRSVVTERATRGRTARRAQLQRAGLDVALLALAGVALWQLQRFGSALNGSVRESVGIDPLLVAAPALGLVGGAIIALRILPLAARGADFIAASGRGVVAPLGAWQLARRPLRYAPIALLLIVTVALGVFGLTYGSSWMTSQRDQAAFSTGADIRVEPLPGAPTMGLASGYGELPAVSGVTAVLRGHVDLVGVTSADLLLLDARAAASVALLRSDLGPLRDLLNDLAARRPEVALPQLPGAPGRLAVDLRLDVGGEPGGTGGAFVVPEMRLAVVLRDADGVLHRVTGDPLGTDGTAQRVVLDLGSGVRAPLTLAGIELQTRVADDGQMSGELLVASAEVSDAADGEAWTPVDLTGSWTAASRSAGRPNGSAEMANAAEPQVTFTSAGPRTGTAPPLAISLIPSSLGTAAITPGIVVSDRFASIGTRGTGSDIPLDLGAGPTAVPIIGQVGAIPGTDPERAAAVADLATVSLARYVEDGTVLRPSEWWLAVDGDAKPAMAALHAGGSRTLIGRAERAAEQQNDPVALGVLGALAMGVIAAATFAFIGFVASTAMAARERLSEFAALRALGLSSRQLAGWLAIENVTLILLGLVIGTALGLLIAGVVVPFVALTPSGGAPFPPLRLVVPWGEIAAFEAIVIGGLVVALATIVLLLRRIGLGVALRIGED